MIYGTGLPRTGTTSLAAALEILGFSTLHYCPSTGVGGSARDYFSLDKFDPYGNQWDAVVSSELLWDPQHLLEASEYCQDKVILLTRPEEEWLQSIKNWKIAPDRLDALSAQWYSTLSWREEGGALTWGVREGWSPLCEYLEVETPRSKFPHENQKLSMSLTKGEGFADSKTTGGVCNR